jgi:aspartokinase
MMCLGASDYNFNFLVSDDDSEKAIQNLHNKFIGCCNENSTAR